MYNATKEVFLHQQALRRTMRRSIINVVGNEELTDTILDSIMRSHPHLCQVWDDNTCRGCRGILSALEKVEGHYCEFCRWQTDHDQYVDSLRKYGSE